ncbi:MAG: elongation factor G [candidate division WOR-3 bacterium]|nr:elongation factor G [candidate division WOR-3 bacterium]
MKEYSSDHIKNIGFFGHGGCGKTTISEAILYNLKQNTRLGRVDEGNALLNYDEDEINRKISINLALGYGEYKDNLINIIDTPGYADFIGEVYSGLRAADNAIVVIDAISGIEVGTEIIWKLINQYELPRLIFINKLRKEHSDFYKVLDEVIKKFGSKICPIFLPVGKQVSFEGIVNLVYNKAYKDKEDTVKEIPIPDELKDKISQYRDKLIEACADVSEAIMNKFLEGGEITSQELAAAIKQGAKEGKLFPVLCGDGYDNIGVKLLLDFIVESMPASIEIGEIKGTKPRSEEVITKKKDPKGPPIGFVFKTVSEPHIGDLNYIKVLSGTIESGMVLLNSNAEKEEKINQIYYVKGKERTETNKLRTGEIGALVKLKLTRTSHTLSRTQEPFVVEPIKFPEPSISVAIMPKSKGDEEKVSNGLARLHEEDPTFSYKYEHELKQQHISGLGELHLDVIVGRLKRKFDVTVDLVKPRIPYRETIMRKAEAQGKYKKQSGGRGQYGDVWLRLEPKERGSGFEFIDEIYAGAVPSKYLPSVEKGVLETMSQGVLAGYPVVDLQATIYDGSYHEVDSSDIAFKIAGQLAFKAAGERAGLVLLEPIMIVEVRVPDQYMGDAIGDLNARRGRIMGVETEGTLQVIKAQVPQAEMYKYSTTLRSMTQGRGYFSMKFSHYEEVPREIAAKIIEESKREKEKA